MTGFKNNPFYLWQLGHDWVFYIISSYLPKYLSNVLHLPVKEVGLYSGITYLSMWIVSLVSGFISDFLIVRNYLSITNARKVFTTLGEYYLDFGQKKRHVEFCMSQYT